tara:strand:+ start:873 stop:1076 length:204 start_codon:yes stop_codon:yes gene_type:complete
MPKINYVSPLEKFFHEANPLWEYKNGKGYDFIQHSNNKQIKIEVAQMAQKRRNMGIERIYFPLVNGS